MGISEYGISEYGEYTSMGISEYGEHPSMGKSDQIFSEYIQISMRVLWTRYLQYPTGDIDAHEQNCTGTVAWYIPHCYKTLCNPVKLCHALSHLDNLQTQSRLDCLAQSGATALWLDFAARHFAAPLYLAALLGQTWYFRCEQNALGLVEGREGHTRSLRGAEMQEHVQKNPPPST